MRLILYRTLQAGLMVWGTWGGMISPVHADPTAEAAQAFKGAFLNVRPHAKASVWRVPFQVPNRNAFSAVRVVSVFGAPRNSYLRGHIHTGLDLVPRWKHPQAPRVFPVAAGVVCSIHLADPHVTVVVRHLLPDGNTLFTSYKHLGAVFVKMGQQVTSETLLARLYTRAEARALGGNYDHLHFEVRRSFDDFGAASWTTMTRVDLLKRFWDPRTFLRRHLQH